jgi:hypothetical protein
MVSYRLYWSPRTLRTTQSNVLCLGLNMNLTWSFRLLGPWEQNSPNLIPSLNVGSRPSVLGPLPHVFNVVPLHVAYSFFLL